MPEESVWEDDLLLSNVRSFDVKAYDPEAVIYSALAGTPIAAGYYDLGYAASIPASSTLLATGQLDLITLGHEGRIPPLVADSRSDAQFPATLPNLGDNNPNTVRLRRVWDSWSVAYSSANAVPMNPILGPYNGLQPIVPSYPAPYPVPLRGIQIQIRVTDPSNQRVKSLTIKQDFSAHL